MALSLVRLLVSREPAALVPTDFASELFRLEIAVAWRCAGRSAAGTGRSEHCVEAGGQSPEATV